MNNNINLHVLRAASEKYIPVSTINENYIAGPGVLSREMTWVFIGVTMLIYQFLQKLGPTVIS